MSRKQVHEEHENHERWLVSYADFITLLFAFFVMLYATAPPDVEKVKAMRDAVDEAFDGGMPQALLDVISFEDAAASSPAIVPNRLTQEAAEPLIYTVKRNLTGSLSDNVVQIGLVDQKLTLVLPERLLFAAGSAELHPSAYALLMQVARVLRTAPVVIDVIGYADGVPVASGGRWEDNWALASARSLAVVRYLSRHGVSVNRLTAGASVTPAADAEARAVSLRILVDAPGPAAEVQGAFDKTLPLVE